MKAVAIIQARLGSTRLPGKVLLDLAGEPMLVRVVDRVRRAATISEAVVATTVEARDEAIADLCAARGWACFRGSELDVLDRYYHAAREFDAEVVVRITSDCPLIDPGVIDRVVRTYLDLRPHVDYVWNGLEPRTYPRGLDVEVFSFAALEESWRKDDNPGWREHVTEYICRHSEHFRLHGVVNEVDLSHLRWTVDTAEDLDLARRIFAHFGHDRFGWRDVLTAWESHPEWATINRHVVQKSVP